MQTHLCCGLAAAVSDHGQGHLAFQILDGAYRGNGWDIIREVEGVIWGSLGGILQADDEGFSNEDGYSILWQFNDDVEGPWHMALLQAGQWVSFQMNLGNRKQRAAFLRGEMPKGVKVQ